MRQRYPAALIGLGNISLGYDNGKGEPPLTHVASLRREARVRLTAGCAPVAIERKRFHALTGATVYESPEEMLRAERPDLVSVCSPTELHFAHAMLCVEAGVKMLWLEKPPVASVAEGEALLEAVRRCGTTVMVGYQRRYAEPFVSLRAYLKRGARENLLAVSVHYSLKLRRNGCHALDAVSFLLGDPEFSLAGVVPGGDPETPSFLLQAEDLPISFTGLAGEFHSLDIILTFKGEQIEILNGGKLVFHRRVEADPRYPSRWLGSPEFAPFPTLDEQNGMADSLTDLLDSFEKGRQPVSNLESAMKTQRIMESVLKEAKR